MSPGRFPEKSAVDRLDKSLSRPIFFLPLPSAAEFLLSFPAVWFGHPLFSLGLIPSVVAALTLQQGRLPLCCTTLPLATAGVTYWSTLCWESLSCGSGLKRSFAFLGLSTLLGLPNFSMALLTVTGSTEAATRAAAHYLSSWFYAQVLIEALKGLTWRLRPVVSMPKELDAAPRHFGEIGDLMKQPSQANLSFPSGDAAGGAIFGTVVAMTSPSIRPLAIAVAALCGFGRIYFRCHHLLDVLVGQCIGVGAAWIIGHYSKPSWLHVVLAQCVLVGLWKPAQKLKPRDGSKQALDLSKLTKNE